MARNFDRQRPGTGWLALAALVVALVISGCAGGDVSELDDDPGADAGQDTGGVDAGTDTGGDPDTDGIDPDTGSPPVATPTAAPGAGGATVETSGHQIRLIIGPRGGSQTVETAGHRIQMGAGHVQHSQVP